MKSFLKVVLAGLVITGCGALSAHEAKQDQRIADTTIEFNCEEDEMMFWAEAPTIAECENIEDFYQKYMVPESK